MAICKTRDINIEHEFDKELSPTMMSICREILISIIGMVDLNKDLDVLNKKLLKMMRRKEGMIKKTYIIQVYAFIFFITFVIRFFNACHCGVKNL